MYFDLDLIFHYAKITLLQKSEMKPTGGTLSDAVLFDKSSSFYKAYKTLLNSYALLGPKT